MRRRRRRRRRRSRRRGSRYRKNRQIRVPKVRVVGDNVEQQIVSTKEALKMAEEKGLDLVEVAPKARPPVCKILDFNKFMYKKKKKQKEIKQKTAKTVVKEIRFTPHTEEHDFNFKTNHAEKFLKDGAKVKAFVQFKGRAIIFKDQGREMLEKFAETLKEYGKVEHRPKMEGRRMYITLAPIKSKKKN